MPSRAKLSLCRLSGWCWPYLSNRIIASRLGPARPRGIAWNGAGGWVIFSQARQVNFSRTVWITFHCRGTTSSVSVTSSPSLTSLPPQHGQAEGAGMTTRSRGRCAGNGARTGLRRATLRPRPRPAGLTAAAASAAARILARRSPPAPRAAVPAGRAAGGGARRMVRTARASAWRSAACRWAIIASAPDARASACGAPRARRAAPPSAPRSRREDVASCRRGRLNRKISRLTRQIEPDESRAAQRSAGPLPAARYAAGSASRSRRAYRPAAPARSQRPRPPATAR